MSRLTPTKEIVCDSPKLTPFATCALIRFVRVMAEFSGFVAAFECSACLVAFSTSKSWHGVDATRSRALSQCSSIVNHLRVVYFTLLYLT